MTIRRGAERAPDWISTASVSDGLGMVAAAWIVAGAMLLLMVLA